jgi:chitin disaccharide deacetylase
VNTTYLIVHADDFGFSPGISDGILYAIKWGIVSSVSVMVIGPYIQNTKHLIKDNPRVDWGLHVAFEKSGGITDDMLLNETEKQLQMFHRFFHISPSHIDYHKGFMFNSKMYFKIRMLALRYNLAFRYDNAHLVNSSFYGLTNNHISLNDISVSALTYIINSLSPGFTELICHPGWTSNHLRDPYRTQRNIEVKTLINPLVKKIVSERKIQIINFMEYNAIQKEFRI